MFYHKDCNGILYGKMKLDFYYSIGVGKKSTSMGLGEIIWEETGVAVPAEYFCLSCKQKVEIKEINGLCGYCGKNLNSSELFKPLGERNVSLGSIGCKMCLEKYLDNIKKLIPMTEILEKVYIPER